ncbi:MAG: hypothetical protein JNJ88_09085 [Planctomycetes bacterium]|nr:hypothetical protein [Planctomycetota bacterium]
MVRAFLTDLDGCAIDAADPKGIRAGQALAMLRARGWAVGIVTSRTAAEVAQLWSLWDLRPPAVVESGGALLLGDLPDGALRSRAMPTAFGPVVPLGAAADDLWESMRDAVEARADVRRFRQLSDAELSEVLGLPTEDLARARDRRWSEPLVVGGPRESRTLLGAEFERLGLHAADGGKLLHVLRGSDKGRGAAELLTALGSAPGAAGSVGVGDAPGDVSFLQIVASAFVIRAEGKPHFPAMLAALPRAHLVAEPGSAGWRRVVAALAAAAD